MVTQVLVLQGQYFPFSYFSFLFGVKIFPFLWRESEGETCIKLFRYQKA